MITINNSIFDAQGATKKDKVYGITLNGTEEVLISGCTFRNKGYSAVLNHNKGNVIIKDCIFECDEMYNPIEGSQAVDNGNVVVKNCEFLGAPGNNYVNFYQVADNSEHIISNCKFNPTVDNNTLRLSNRTSAKAKFIVKDCEYNFAEGEPTEYTALLLCQDYTNKNGVKQDFTKYSVEIDNVLCDGVKIEKDAVAKGNLYYVYEDGKGIITNQDNDPVIVVK